MFKYKKLKFHINTMVLVILIIVLLFIGLFSTTFMVYTNVKHSENTRLTEQYKEYANELLLTSNALTYSAYKYVTTGNDEYHIQYTQELTVSKTRENATKALLDLGVTDQERVLINQALELSNYVILIEQSAFELVDFGEHDEAVKLFFDAYYEGLIEQIVGNYETLIDDISTRTREEAEHTLKVINMSYRINVIIVFLTIISTLLLLFNMLVCGLSFFSFLSLIRFFLSSFTSILIFLYVFLYFYLSFMAIGEAHVQSTW